MLKLRIHPGDIAGPWSWTGRRWQAGTSWIEPHSHPALEVLGPDEDSPALIVRERCPGSTGQPHSVDWPGDFVTVQPGTGAMWLEAGTRGIAPLYLIEHGGVLHGSWDVADLAPSLRTARLNDREVVRQLSTTFRYTRETLWEGLYWLTERSRAAFDDRGLRLCYPLPAPHGLPRQLHPDADPVSAYERLLAQALDWRAYDPATTAVELSGGLDSANVAATLGSRHPEQITAAAMLILDEAGRQQHERRRQMIDLFGLGADVTTNMIDNLPLRPGGRRASRALITPFDELYDEGKASLLRLLRECGVRTVATGLGGDEMVSLTIDELPRQAIGVGTSPAPWLGDHTRELLEDFDIGIAPASVINEVTLLSMACVAPPLLRAGMWPLHPLADPALIRFGEWLPYRWRYLKRLHVARLERLGCSRYLVDPPLHEDFEPVMGLGLRRYGASYLRSMLHDGSPLIEAGYLDPNGLTAAAARLEDGLATVDDHAVINAIVLEATLRSYGHKGSPVAVAVGGASTV